VKENRTAEEMANGKAGAANQYVATSFGGISERAANSERTAFDGNVGTPNRQNRNL